MALRRTKHPFPSGVFYQCTKCWLVTSEHPEYEDVCRHRLSSRKIDPFSNGYCVDFFLHCSKCGKNVILTHSPEVTRQYTTSVKALSKASAAKDEGYIRKFPLEKEMGEQSREVAASSRKHNT